MAVGKTGERKEVGEKPIIIMQLGKHGKEKLVTTFLN
jgi:hypothetical protein